jgi:aspartate/methionine/tyrosine aminotransferase
MLGHNYFSFDVYRYRGKKLKAKLESYLKTGKVSSLVYSNPNNPTWICLNEEELSIIGELCSIYDVIVIEDLAYFGMDFRKDYSKPGEPPYQPTVAHYTDDYVLLISSSKVFSYAGQRIALMAISDHLFSRSYPDLLRYYSSDNFGHAAIFGALYGNYKFRDDIIEYGHKSEIMKKLFLENGFRITYDKDLDVPIADGFYFTISYPGMTAAELIDRLLRYGISAITLDTTGSERKDALRACVSMVPRSLFGDLEYRLKCFNRDNKV